MTLSRRYVPAIGKRVTLRTFADYNNLPVSVWAWLTVRAIDGETVTVEHYNARDTGEFFTVPLLAIAPPVGWKQRYTIHAQPDKVDTVLSWFDRGIAVRQSHDMSGSMPCAFQPLDNSNSPHWQFPELTDVIPADECGKVFQVVKIERQDVYDVYLVPDSACKFCNGTGKRHVQTIADVRKVPIADVLADTELIARLEGYDALTGLFTCHCIRGGFRTLGRSKRAKVIKEWAAQGWDTHYCNYGEHSFWERTRETIVRDWE
jgi:hypothetical protein